MWQSHHNMLHQIHCTDNLWKLSKNVIKIYFTSKCIPSSSDLVTAYYVPCEPVCRLEMCLWNHQIQQRHSHLTQGHCVTNPWPLSGTAVKANHNDSAKWQPHRLKHPPCPDPQGGTDAVKFALNTFVFMSSVRAWSGLCPHLLTSGVSGSRGTLAFEQH